MVSVPRDFTDGLLVDDRFRSERQAAARRGAANYKNLEALAQKFWKSQEPRMPEVGRKRPVLQPISTRTTANHTSRDVESSENISTSRQILASIPFKNRVRFASDGTPLTVASKDQKLRDHVSVSHEQLHEEYAQERLDEPMNVSTKSLISESTGTNTEEVSSNNMSSGPMATITQTSSFSLQRQDASTLKKSLQNDGDIFLGFERKRMRTYQKKIPFYYNQPNSDDMETSRSSISESSDLSPRTVYNQRRRKINMQFTSNNGQVTVIEPYDTERQIPAVFKRKCKEEAPPTRKGTIKFLSMQK
ncbi:uncharacterized protein [Ptychodera flava]|uniref:uncharacterized protein n=1 Tax=Ptychodera flava TaxID=63121 RepID=UPI003969E86D